MHVGTSEGTTPLALLCKAREGAASTTSGRPAGPSLTHRGAGCRPNTWRSSANPPVEGCEAWLQQAQPARAWGQGSAVCFRSAPPPPAKGLHTFRALGGFLSQTPPGPPLSPCPLGLKGGSTLPGLGVLEPEGIPKSECKSSCHLLSTYCMPGTLRWFLTLSQMLAQEAVF